MHRLFIRCLLKVLIINNLKISRSKRSLSIITFKRYYKILTLFLLAWVKATYIPSTGETDNLRWAEAASELAEPWPDRGEHPGPSHVRKFRVDDDGERLAENPRLLRARQFTCWYFDCWTFKQHMNEIVEFFCC